MSDQTTEPTPAERQQAERKKKYKKSLNLPKTSFPMRANLAQNEPQSRKRWERMELYRRILEARSESERFAFHDGPPYANGSIHVGHLLNKVLKDVVVRSQTMAGRLCHYVPGWDCHGLPIEHRVMADLIESGKAEKIDALEPDVRRMAIRRECHRYAEKYQKIQAEQLQRLLTLADYDHPYLTMSPGYERAVLEVFAGLLEQGLVYRDVKPVHWSIANRTALADAELEYRERQDPSIYVHFEAADPAAVAAAFGVELEAGGEPPAFMIWTTTPWTLPANLMIAVAEEIRYTLVRIDGRPTVIATELVDAVAGLGGGEGGRRVERLAEAPGSALVGLGYRHPFIDRRGRIVAADYVTVEDGTGLVHTAPGHGEEDYLTGMREGEEIYCPVRADGTFDDTVPEWLRGRSVWEANELVVERLRGSGHLHHHLRFTHSYPHDWRSKTPVIFRCTEQWFIAVDRPTAHGRSLRDLGLGACEEEIRFVPGWGAKRLRGMLESRPDWCISRQRSWGLPIPAFRAADGSVLMTPATVRAVGEHFASGGSDAGSPDAGSPDAGSPDAGSPDAGSPDADGSDADGSDAWFTKPPSELLAGWDPAADPDAPAGIDVSKLEKMYDIFDVWFESGSSWNAVMRRRELGFPVDLYLEGSDQHRGWFQLSLLPGLGVTGHSPFKTLLTHGFMVDKEGKKMSKSLGNALEVEELLQHFGADVCRWWVSSLAFEVDVKVDLSYFELAGESYRKVRNTLRFLLSNLHDFDPGRDGVDPAELDPTSLDAYALERAGELREKVVAAYLNYEFRQAHLLLFNFCNETLSAFYLDAVKDRLYCDRPDSPRRRATQTAVHRLADLLGCLLAPILPHTADETHRALTGDEKGSIHLRTFPEVAIAADPEWARVLEVRDAALKALESAKSEGIENPLDAGLVLPDPDGLLDRFRADLVDAMGVSRVALQREASEIEVVDLREEPRCERSWRRDETVRQRDDGGWLSDRDAEAVGVA